MATLTVNSLSVTPGGSWPVDAAVGIVAARTAEGGALKFVPSGTTLPASSAAGTWSGTPTVQTDFSP